MKLEAVVIPVSDVDRGKEFYGSLGWRLDADFTFDNGFRVVQFTPPGSGCSVQFGTKITSSAPGSVQGLYLIVSDIEAARNEIVARGVEVSEVFHAGTPGAQFQPVGAKDRIIELLAMESQEQHRRYHELLRAQPIGGDGLRDIARRARELGRREREVRQGVINLNFSTKVIG